MDLIKTSDKKFNLRAQTKRLSVLSILTALSVVSSLFLTWRGGEFTKFSPTFIIIVLAARCYGVYGAVMVSLLSDIIQFAMFPANGFSIGICISSVLSGVIYGIFLYKEINLSRIVISSLSAQVFCSLFVTTFTMVYIEKWYDSMFPLVYFRLVQVVIMSIASIILLYILFVKYDITKLLKLKENQ